MWSLQNGVRSIKDDLEPGGSVMEHGDGVKPGSWSVGIEMECGWRAEG